MRISIVRGAPAYHVPGAAIAAGAVLFTLGLVAAALLTDDGGPVICPFRAMTGLPCPTCGLLRTAHHLLGGHIASAFAVNPFDALAMLVGAPVVLAVGIANRLGGWAVRFSLSSRERRIAWLVLGAFMLANWIYVLATQQ